MLEVTSEAQELEEKTKKSLDTSRVLLWSMVIFSIVGILGLATVIFFQPAPASFLRITLETPVITPTGESVSTRGPGNVRMRAWVESPLDPPCLVSTQYFIMFSDNSMAQLPGLRITTLGSVKESLYEAGVPVSSPPGKAQFFIRDTYNCGLKVQRVESNPTIFTITTPETKPPIGPYTKNPPVTADHG